MNPSFKHLKLGITAGLSLALLAGAGCRSIGPGTVPRDRLQYSTAVADSWKQQLLLNIVKLRYGDAPTFMEVTSVVSGYSLETAVGLSSQFSPQNRSGDTFLASQATGTYTDRPTISYSPMSGEQFAHSLMAPIPLDSLMFVVQGGMPAGFMLGLTLNVFERYHNSTIFGAELHPADPQFLRQIQLLNALQRASAIGVEVIRQGPQPDIWLSFNAPETLTTEAASQVAELKELLGIPAGLDRASVIFGAEAKDPGVIGMRTRSLLHIMRTMAEGIEIPQEDLDDGSASPGNAALSPDGFTVNAGEKEPARAFAAVQYENHWFWIDRTDFASKTTFSIVTMMMSFLEANDEQSGPVLTIPTN